MTPKLGEVLLVDDYDADNFMHEMLFDEMGVSERVTVATNGREAIEYLTTPKNGQYPRPELILLDINMPIMNGWDFLKAYQSLDDNARGDVVLMMVTTSLNPDDREAARSNPDINDFVTKALSEDSLNNLLRKHFPNRF